MAQLFRIRAARFFKGRKMVDPVQSEENIRQGRSRQIPSVPSKWTALAGLVILLTLFVVSRFDYRIFHTLAELFSVIVAFSLFIVLWNTKDLVENKALMLIGIAYLFIGGIDLIHTLAYKGMGLIRAETGSNPATQLWIFARGVEGITLLVFPFLFFRKINPYTVFGIYFLVTGIGLLSIFYWEIFPVCYVEGAGLTVFKKNAEYAICVILIAAVVLLRQKKSLLDPLVYRYMVTAIVLTILGELAFTFYVSVYGLSNLIGHYCKIISFYCIYLALIRSGLTQPYSVLFSKTKQNETMQRKMFSNIGDVIVIIDKNGVNRYKSPNVEKLFGWKPEELVGASTWDNVHPDDLASAQEFVGRLMQEPNAVGTMECRYRCGDGSYRWIEFTGNNLLHDPDICGLLGNYSDITGRRQAEKEHEKLRDQLIQAQKMESVGRLAGGVAHDFNNIMGVILGFSELAMEKADPSGPIYEDLQEIYKAARRSADITRQLLSFARKQTIAPRSVDLNEMVEGMLRMLRRLIGEDIDLIWKPAGNLWPVKMDPSQIDQILANLCVNSRDAIDDVGRITIETHNIGLDRDFCAGYSDCIPGDYVLLAVSDDGCGMTPETKDNLFEPFFTTKGVGKGTGLGLATVYGIVRQNNGFIHVDSEPEQGTAFRIYLPRHENGVEPIRGKDPVVNDVQGSETILLVEDEPAILKMTKTMLERLGYTMLTANTPGRAMDLARKHAGGIHLLMTDVVMPEMNGRDLASNLLSLYPGLKCLFMSGYTADVIAHHGMLNEGMRFIQKPFSKKDLAVKVREALSR
ncbi:MAG: PAS domain S-box protein [Desulfobacteraceae bacterium]|nr:MAG: PAS domain S-box protein [Desulfobacteraceae bacterium]